MHVELGRSRRNPFRSRLRGAIAVIASLVLALPRTYATVLHLTTGAQIVGELVAQDETNYQIKTGGGIVLVPRDSVTRIESNTTDLPDQYSKRFAALADTVDGHLALAKWCDEVGLLTESRVHFRRVLELDANHAEARARLGFVRVGETWVEARTAVESDDDDKKKKRQKREQIDAAKLLAAIQQQWIGQIRAIRAQFLDATAASANRNGRERILAITDPLAVLPLARVLSDGSVFSRRVLIEALAEFDEDEATLNLASLALLDDDAEVRRQATLELKRRDDPRIAAQMRKGLQSNNDVIVTRAAVTLGMLQAKSAIPELIAALTAERARFVEVPVQQLFGDMSHTFQRETRVQLGSSVDMRHRPQHGNPAGLNKPMFRPTRQELRQVTVLRTEVMEALKAITGENFGFDATAWSRWYEEQKP